MSGAKKQVLLIFRSRARAGTSIEALFLPFLATRNGRWRYQAWVYQGHKSLVVNVGNLRRQVADVWHVTGDIQPMILFLPANRTVLTIHDIGRYKELRGWRKWLFGKLWVEWPVRRARRTITVSAFTRSDIYTHFPRLHDKSISVIHNGISPVFRPAPLPPSRQHPVFLQVGTAVHKNLATVIKALEGYACTLVIIGRLSAEQRSALIAAGIAFESYVDLDEQAVYAQYVRATLVLFVSLHEGFGLPVVEAQAVGRPVITTRCAALPEVAADGAAYLDDPLDHMGLRQLIDHVLKNEEYRDALIRAGLENASRYSEKAMREAYELVYSDIADA